jgi:hypothetical protein
MSDDGIPAALVALIRRNRRRYGGYLVHAGVAVLFIGIAASSSFQDEREVLLEPGQSAAVGAYRVTYVKPTADLRAAGKYEGGERLRPTSSATTVRKEDGRTLLSDGPFAETKEQLGGYFLIEAPDLDEALAWAKRCPGAATGSIEVRPVWTM